MPDYKFQADMFKQAARDLASDPDEAMWEDKLRSLEKPKSEEKPANAKT